MARLRYYDLLVAIRDTLAADPNIRAARATVEIARAVVGTAMSPHINVTELRRDTLAVGIAAGTQHRYRVRWRVTVSVFSAAGFEDAMKQRDELVGYIETAIMATRNFGGALTDKQTLLDGGELRSAPGEAGGFWAQADVDLSAEIKFSTT